MRRSKHTTFAVTEEELNIINGVSTIAFENGDRCANTRADWVRKVVFEACERYVRGHITDCDQCSDELRTKRRVV